MNRRNEITIVVSCDTQYLVLLAALIKSIEANVATSVKVDLYIVEDDISVPDKRKLELSSDPVITAIHWKKMAEVIPAGMKLPLDKTSFPLNIYMRLFIPYFVPEGTEKVLFMDVDMISQKDVSLLFNTELGDHVIAAVQDPRIKTFDNPWGGVINYKELGLSGDTKYFNAGTFLLNIKKWKEIRVTERVIQCIEENRNFANYPDQYGLNIVLAGQWLQLDPLWNHFADNGGVSPYIIHFIERKPIYKSYTNDPIYREVFFKYLKLTKWSDFEPIDESKRYIKKLRNVFQKVKMSIFG